MEVGIYCIMYYERISMECPQIMFKLLKILEKQGMSTDVQLQESRRMRIAQRCLSHTKIVRRMSGQYGHLEFSQPMDLHRQFAGYYFRESRGIMRDMYYQTRMSVHGRLHGEVQFLNLEFLDPRRKLLLSDLHFIMLRGHKWVFELDTSDTDSYVRHSWEKWVY